MPRHKIVLKFTLNEQYVLDRFDLQKMWFRCARYEDGENTWG